MRYVNAILTYMRMLASFRKPKGRLGIVPEAKANGIPAVSLKLQVWGNSCGDGKLEVTHEHGNGGDSEQPSGKGRGEKSGGGAKIVSVIGTITLIGPTQLTVGGKVVVVGPGTELHGVPITGLRARAQGWLQPDRNIVATSVEIL